MLALRLGPRGGDRPHVVLSVDLGPLGPAHLAGPRGSQHQKLERELDDGSRPRRPHRLDDRRHVTMRQRRHVPDEILLWAEDRPDAAARVVVAVVQRHGVLHDGADALADPSRRRRPLVPDLAERLHHVGARHLGDGQLAEPREREAFHAGQPVLAVLRIAPSGPHLRQDRLGGGGEGGHALEAALLGERIASGAGEPAGWRGPGRGRPSAGRAGSRRARVRGASRG